MGSTIVGINTKYKLETKQTWRGYDRTSNADLNGNDIRFVYGAVIMIFHG